MLSSFIICISLFAVFSVEGQVLPDGRGADDPLVQALRWERVVYGSDDPVRTHQALEAKAGCYAEAGLFEDAVATLERIRMYLLEADDVSEILLLKARYSHLAGDDGTALGYLEESGKAESEPGLYAVLLAGSWRLSEAREWALRWAGDDVSRKEAVRKLFKKAPHFKKEGTATLLSMIPPAGQMYLGKPSAGAASLLLNAGAAAFTALELLDHNWVTGFLGGGLLLNETYFKANLQKNLSRLDDVNRVAAKRFSSELEALLAPSVFPRKDP